MPELPPEQLPHKLDFTTPPQGIFTRPQNPAEIHPVPGGTPVLQWRLEDARDMLNVLALPFGIAPSAQTLRLMLRAEPEARLHIGLRERGGATYSIERTAGPQWDNLSLPLPSFKLGPRQRDEDGRLDLDQVSSFVIVILRRPEDTRAAGPPQIVELDDVRAE